MNIKFFWHKQADNSYSIIFDVKWISSSLARDTSETYDGRYRCPYDVEKFWNKKLSEHYIHLKIPNR